MNTPRSEARDLVRFERKFQKTNACWVYTGFVDKNGYGQFWSNGRTVLPHRYSYERYVGSIPASLVIDHLCKNRSCVNPDHMEVVTLAENSRRSSTSQNNLKKTHCIRGHEFSEKNTYIHITTRERVCRKCKTLLANKYRKYGKQ